MIPVDRLEQLDEMPRRWPKRLFWGSLALVLLTGLGAFAYLKWKEFGAERQLNAIVAELDANDPYWRLEAIEAHRKAIPDEENAALVVLQVVAQIPKPAARQWTRDPPKSWDERLSESSPEQQLAPDIYYELRKELKGIEPLVIQARGLAKMKDGRFPITYASNFIGTLLPHVQNARDLFELLRKDMLVRARENDIDGALESARAMLIAARSIGDEPFVVSQLVRMGCDSSVVRSVERVLAQGQATEQGLAQLQRLLADEEGTQFLVTGFRGERAGLDIVLQALKDGTLPPKSLAINSGNPKPSNFVTDAWDSVTVKARARHAHPIVLRMLTESIEITQLPTEQRLERFKAQEQQANSPSFPEIARLLTSAKFKFAESDMRTRAFLRCAIAAIAAERFRLANERWPKDLAELVPAYLQQVPVDPYDGKPLRLRFMPEGLLVYSIGPDCQDDGGTINRKMPNVPGQDIVFQLWNMDERRTPARNPDVGPPRPTEEDLQEMDWPMPRADDDPPEEEPKPDKPGR